MHEQIKVTVVEFGDRQHYQMQWRDPMTGKKKTKTTGVERTGRKKEREEALRVAAKHEADLRENRYKSPSKITWSEFRERYSSEVLNSLADATDQKASTVLDLVESILSPAKLRDVTAERLSYFQSRLRADGRSENTIASYLAHLQAALRWAARVGLMTTAPRIEKPRRAKGGQIMKGRPITLEEFERMIEKLPAVLAAEKERKWRPLGDAAKKSKAERQASVVASFKRYLEGLWLSGLRLGESLALSWDDQASLHIDLSAEFPMLRIPAEREKGNKDRLLPIVPDFAEFLLQTPREQRTGHVFPLACRRGADRQMQSQHVSAVICKVGKAAGVKVNTDPKTGKVKFASAHDLRRAFGERWASKVMPQVLKELMRHETIDTTLKFYVGRNAQTTAKVPWEQFAISNTSGNKPQNGDPAEGEEIAASACAVARKGKLPRKDSNLE